MIVVSVCLLTLLMARALRGLWTRTRSRLRTVARIVESVTLLVALSLGMPPMIQAASPVINAQGVPITPNAQVVLTESLNHRGMLLDAEATPLLFIATWQVSARQMATVEHYVAHLPGLHRPLIVVSTFFTQPRTAITTTQTWMHRNRVTLPVVIQEGPPKLYVHTTPVLLTAHDGHLVRYVGWSAVLAHLSNALVIPSTPTPKIRHRTGPSHS